METIGEYNVTRTMSGYSDKENYTVKVTIVGTQKLIDGNKAFIWQYQYPSGNDTNYVTITNDTVKIYDPFRIETLRNLQFPLNLFDSFTSWKKMGRKVAFN